MNDRYECLKMEVIAFKTEDIITDSTIVQGDNGDSVPAANDTLSG